MEERLRAGSREGLNPSQSAGILLPDHSHFPESRGGTSAGLGRGVPQGIPDGRGRRDASRMRSRGGLHDGARPPDLLDEERRVRGGDPSSEAFGPSSTCLGALVSEKPGRKRGDVSHAVGLTQSGLKPSRSVPSAVCTGTPPERRLPFPGILKGCLRAAGRPSDLREVRMANDKLCLVAASDRTPRNASLDPSEKGGCSVPGCTVRAPDAAPVRPRTRRSGRQARADAGDPKASPN